jgi:hypothetical protein
MNGEQPKKKRRWIPIVLGVLFVCFVLAAAAIFLTVSWFRQNMVVTEASEGAATRQFDDVHARFPGQQPLIQLVDGKPQYVAERASQSSSQTTLTTLHVLAFDSDEGKVVNFSLPFWILRMKSGPIRISAYQQGWDDRGVSFKIEDIEKHGPGIIVDANDDRRNGRVLIWAE